VATATLSETSSEELLSTECNPDFHPVASPDESSSQALKWVRHLRGRGRALQVSLAPERETVDARI
jgi:CHASE1-domain containing sensor protein